MSFTFTKLFSSITESTVWMESHPTRIVWVTMLAMADRKGRVWASIPGLANRSRVSVDECRAAIAKFLGPDEDSRTKEHDGRRIEEIDGGWKLLNYDKYRSIRDEETILESKRKYINTRRALAKNVENVDKCRSDVDRSRPLLTQAEAEAEAEAEKEKDTNPSFEEQVYALYPKKVGKQAALKAIRTAMVRIGGDSPAGQLMRQTQAFADAISSWPPTDRQFIPHPATWFGRGSYDDDPAEWVRLQPSVPWQRDSHAIDHDKGF